MLLLEVGEPPDEDDDDDAEEMEVEHAEKL